MGQKMHKVSWYTDEEEVADYYIKRLKKLETIAKRSKGKAPFIEGKQLIEQPEQTLHFISKYLQLQQPLQKEYDTFSLTGTVGLGDPSEHIKTGKIVKERDKYAHIRLTPAVIERCMQQYESTKTILQSICKTI